MTSQRLLKNTLLATAFVFLIAASSAMAQVTDKIWPVKGVAANGTVSRMTATAVYLESGGAEQEFLITAIRKVTFADEPSELDRARDLVIAGRYNDALAELTKVNAANLTIEFMKKDHQFFLGKCAAQLALRGEFPKGPAVAIDFVKRFVDDPTSKQNYHYFEAVESLADLYYGTGDFAGGEKQYQVLVTGAPGNSKVRAMVRKGECQIGQENYAAASTTFDTVIKANLGSFANGEEQQAFAKIGKATCVAAQGTAADGITLIEEIIRKEDPKNMALFGRAYNAMGACYEKEGKSKDALLAYLHTDILFYGDSNTHAEALYHLVKLWDQDGRSDRSLKAREVLRSRYGGSVWAKRAE